VLSGTAAKAVARHERQRAEIKAHLPRPVAAKRAAVGAENVPGARRIASESTQGEARISESEAALAERRAKLEALEAAALPATEAIEAARVGAAGPRLFRCGGEEHSDAESTPP
jgi:hypothetical protein